MVEKMFAKWKKPSNEFEIISAAKALFLKSPEGKARIVTNPKEKGTLFDIETELKVRPVTGRFIKNKGRKGPDYFAYYNGENLPPKVENPIEWSDELQLFMQVFEDIEKFQIEEDGKPITYVIPQQMKMFEHVRTSFGTVILKFLVEIDYTSPKYSQSYLYNQKIGLEFVFSSLPTPPKLVGLSELGIPVFQAQTELSEWVKRDYGKITDENFEEIKDELIETFQNRNYQLRGKFVNSIQITPENKGKHDTLKSYEEQIEELQHQIKALESQKSVKTESLATAEINCQKTQDLIVQEKYKLEGYKRENEYYEKLESDNINLTKNLAETNNKLNTVNTELSSANKELVTANIKLDNVSGKLKNANDELKRIDAVGWIKRALKKW
ncbi:hypothetical protein [Lactococcus petauri]|uniref:hypothetical protein n=1 Tax=Lactococcus petauri TaxID=1940789 RepID=UPI00254AA970|nr:hypothetical protein [Lactococcus petauri]